MNSSFEEDSLKLYRIRMPKADIPPVLYLYCKPLTTPNTKYDLKYKSTLQMAFEIPIGK